MFGHISTDDCPYPKSFLVNAYFFFLLLLLLLLLLFVVVVVVRCLKSESSYFYLDLYK